MVLALFPEGADAIPRPAQVGSSLEGGTYPGITSSGMFSSAVRTLVVSSFTYGFGT